MAKNKKEPKSKNVSKEDINETDEKDLVENQENENDSKLEDELEKTNEQLLRVTAEYANFRKRSEKEKSETYAFATAKAVEELLSVVDNMERAIASEQDDYDGLKKGVEMTYDGLMATLEKLGVSVFGEKGEIFDPELHHAVMHEDDDQYEENEIIDVYQKGYKLNDRIIRPAMVKTAN